MAYTLEQKIDIYLRYIAATNPIEVAAIRNLAIEALKADTVHSGAVDVEDLIVDLLTEIGMPPHLIGYKATVLALKLVMDDPTRLDQLLPRLYSEVARSLGPGQDQRSVERAIRRALDITFDRGDVDRIMKLFGGTINIRTGKLTAGEFMAFCERELRRRMKRAGV